MPEPAWTRCFVFSAGYCPVHWQWQWPLSGRATPRAELSQDLALARLGRECQNCALAPPAEEARCNPRP